MTDTFNDFFLRLHGHSAISYSIVYTANEDCGKFTVVKYETLPSILCAKQTVVTIVDTIEAARAFLPTGYAKVLGGSVPAMPKGCEFWQAEGTIANGDIVARVSAIYNTFDQARADARQTLLTTKSFAELEVPWRALTVACRALYPHMSESERKDFVDALMGL